ncbi:MAG: 3'(2'),5'-bisphosphate nucleotidase CysQ [Thiohalomonadales bacterium]
MSSSPFSVVELRKIQNPVIELASLAGGRIMAVYDKGFEITEKQDNTPLTDADMAAHETIIEGLKKLTPDIPVLSEESTDISYSERRKWSRYWLVDPLDGTREFIKRNGEFTVNIALIEKQQSRLGVIYVPINGKCYYASYMNGAYLSTSNSEPQRIFCTSHKRRPVLVAGSRSHGNEALQQYLKNLGNYEISPLGSSLKSCLVAEGQLDLYPRLGPTSEWDTAAAQCIVEESGGRLTDIHMQPIRYNTKESLLNPHFFAYGDIDEDWSKYLP